ncbi:uncharacterized protein EV420DRAFT_1634263 [Desarmillaria tabescens]|uniref:Uncharacterized protein n=1 Tax=Armillaria tabescens TaxID=1929756 RepID=A0AA39NQV5_ARMTA|nr:uncharacterized protein EV420DRAFT_1634263 [Desarmillaria tabescens]KAK0469853.1 hypothetical protein EV420DRAFT_1634263 [Desarmillaria tabescens]
MPPIYPTASLPDVTWISSIASSVADNPKTSLVLCLVLVGTMAYRISPPLSPHTQLKQLNRNIDDVWALINTSDGDIDRDCRHWRCKAYDWLELIQIDACELEICLLQTEKDNTASWSEYFLSLKRVYFGARAVCKEVEAIRTDVKIEHLNSQLQYLRMKKHIVGPKFIREQSESLTPYVAL